MRNRLKWIEKRKEENNIVRTVRERIMTNATNTENNGRFKRVVDTG